MQGILHKSKLVPDFLLHKLKAKSSVGHGIHSPFVFDFSQKVLSERNADTIPDNIVGFHREILASTQKISSSSYGAGSKAIVTPSTLGQLVKTSSVSPKTGVMLFRLCRWVNPKYILEIGTSVGISSIYLATANPDSRVVSLEGETGKIEIARNNFQKLGIKNISILEGDFDYSIEEALTLMPRVDLVFFDGNHRTEPTLRYFKKCLELKHDNSVFIFDDIRWSREMFKTWQIIQTHKSVTLSIDLFNVGLVFFRSGITKQHFSINF